MRLLTNQWRCHEIFFYIFKNQNVTKTDVIKQPIKAVTEIWLKSGISMKSNWLHLKELLKIIES